MLLSAKAVFRKIRLLSLPRAFLHGARQRIFQKKKLPYLHPAQPTRRTLSHIRTHTPARRRRRTPSATAAAAPHPPPPLTRSGATGPHSPCPWPAPPHAPHSAAASPRTAAASPHPHGRRFAYATYELLLSPDRIELLLSGRCVSLLLWLEERYEVVYSRHPEFQAGTRPLLALDNPFPTTLPENLFGDKWAFVQLPFSGQ